MYQQRKKKKDNHFDNKDFTVLQCQPPLFYMFAIRSWHLLVFFSVCINMAKTNHTSSEFKEKPLRTFEHSIKASP